MDRCPLPNQIISISHRCFSILVIARLDGHPSQLEVIQQLQDSIHGLNAYLNVLDSTSKVWPELFRIFFFQDVIIHLPS